MDLWKEKVIFYDVNFIIYTICRYRPIALVVTKESENIANKNIKMKM